MIKSYDLDVGVIQGLSNITIHYTSWAWRRIFTGEKEPFAI